MKYCTWQTHDWRIKLSAAGEHKSSGEGCVFSCIPYCMGPIMQLKASNPNTFLPDIINSNFYLALDYKDSRFKNMIEKLIDRWLYESESDSLDFKRDQYKFIRAANAEKSELLKDILAMINSWRRTDGFIVIGIEEKQEKPNILHGIDKHIDDAQIQQFVNSKVNRPCEFQYFTYTKEGKTLGIIRIPCQERPVFLSKDFGSLRAETVYVRRGSSTDIAKPDEVSKMGSSFGYIPSSNIDVGFYDRKIGDLIGDEIDYETTYLEIIDTIPDYSASAVPYMPSIAGNKDYYRDIIKFINFRNSYIPIELAIRNKDKKEILNIQLEFEIYASDVDIVLDGDEVSEPDTNYKFPHSINYQSMYNLEILDGMCKVKNHLKRLHAKRILAFEGTIYLQSKKSRTINAKAIVFFDGQSSPFEKDMVIRLDVDKRSLKWNDFHDNLLKS